jgi:hypothetical protein
LLRNERHGRFGKLRLSVVNQTKPDDKLLDERAEGGQSASYCD